MVNKSRIREYTIDLEKERVREGEGEKGETDRGLNMWRKGTKREGVSNFL